MARVPAGKRYGRNGSVRMMMEDTTEYYNDCGTTWCAKDTFVRLGDDRENRVECTLVTLNPANPCETLPPAFAIAARYTGGRQIAYCKLTSFGREFGIVGKRVDVDKGVRLADDDISAVFGRDWSGLTPAKIITFAATNNFEGVPPMIEAPASEGTTE